MKYFFALLFFGLSFSDSFAEYKSKSPTSKATAPYLHIMDEQEKNDLKKEHDINSFEGKEEKVELRHKQMMEEKQKKKRDR